MRPLKYIPWILLFILVFASCSDADWNNYEYEVPVRTDDGWEVCSAWEAGLDSSLLVEMVHQTERRIEHNVHSILMIRNNKLFFEKYFEGYLYSNDPPGSNGEFIQYDRETDHFLASVSKTITSVIFGAAVMEGYIESVDERLIDIFPEYDSILTGDKANITLEHLLTMSSGLFWDEWSTSYEDPENDVVALFNEEDPIAYILSKPMINVPGAEFLYNSGGTNILGVVVERKTGMSLLEFGNACLFDPLNIQGGSWMQMAGGYYFASGGIYLRPRELSKIGSLFLNGGYWKGRQVITDEWIAESTMEHIQTNDLLPMAHAYGYQWWIMNFQANEKDYHCFFAAGAGDQYMFIFPDLDMILTFNCGNYLKGGNVSPFHLVENYILPALL